MSPLVAAADLLRLPIRLGELPVGRSLDLILDPDARRVVGLEVLCGDDVTRFLPLAAARVGEAAVSIATALPLLDRSDLEFYRGRGHPLSELRGLTVRAAREPLGTLADVVLDSGTGEVRELVLDRPGEPGSTVQADAAEIERPRRPAA